MRGPKKKGEKFPEAQLTTRSRSRDPQLRRPRTETPPGAWPRACSSAARGPSQPAPGNNPHSHGWATRRHLPHSWRSRSPSPHQRTGGWASWTASETPISKPVEGARQTPTPAAAAPSRPYRGGQRGRAQRLTPHPPRRPTRTTMRAEGLGFRAAGEEVWAGEGEIWGFQKLRPFLQSPAAPPSGFLLSRPPARPCFFAFLYFSCFLMDINI